MKWYKDLKIISLILMSVFLVGSMVIISNDKTELSKTASNLEKLNFEYNEAQYQIEDSSNNIKQLELQLAKVSQQAEKYKKDLTKSKETNRKYKSKHKEEIERYSNFVNKESEYQSEISRLNSELTAKEQKVKYLEANSGNRTESEHEKSDNSPPASTSTKGGTISGGIKFADGQIQSPYTDNNSTETVHITNTGSKYHRSGCQYLRESDISISLSDAKASGYSACSKCY